MQGQINVGDSVYTLGTGARGTVQVLQEGATPKALVAFQDGAPSRNILLTRLRRESPQVQRACSRSRSPELSSHEGCTPEEALQIIASSFFRSGGPPWQFHTSDYSEAEILQSHRSTGKKFLALLDKAVPGAESQPLKLLHCIVLLLDHVIEEKVEATRRHLQELPMLASAAASGQVRMQNLQLHYSYTGHKLWNSKIVPEWEVLWEAQKSAPAAKALVQKYIADIYNGQQGYSCHDKGVEESLGPLLRSLRGLA